MNKTLFLILTSSLLLAMATSVVSASSFVGEWNLIEVYDENDNSVTIPENDNGGKPFVLKVQEKSSDDQDHFSFNIKIGNVLRGSINRDNDNYTDGHHFNLGPVMSTMMMPAEPLWKLEEFLTNAFPKITVIDADDTTTSLEFKGDGGRMKFNREE